MRAATTILVKVDMITDEEAKAWTVKENEIRKRGKKRRLKYELLFVSKEMILQNVFYGNILIPRCSSSSFQLDDHVSDGNWWFRR